MESGITDLIQQLPAGIILMFCGSGLLLVLVVGYLIVLRNRRAAKAVPPVAEPSTSGNFDDLPDFGDLPDLDVLASTEALRVDAPPAPAEFAPAEVPADRSLRRAQRISLTEGTEVDAVEVFTVLRDVAEGGLDHSHWRPSLSQSTCRRRR